MYVPPFFFGLRINEVGNARLSPIYFTRSYVWSNVVNNFVLNHFVTLWSAHYHVFALNPFFLTCLMLEELWTIMFSSKHFVFTSLVLEGLWTIIFSSKHFACTSLVLEGLWTIILFLPFALTNLILKRLLSVMLKPMFNFDFICYSPSVIHLVKRANFNLSCVIQYKHDIAHTYKLIEETQSP